MRSKFLNLRIMMILSSILIGLANFILQRDEVHRIFEYDDTSFLFYRSMRFLAFILSCIIIYYLLSKIVALFIENDPMKKDKCKFWLVYFSLNVVILLLVWPGIFKGDEFYMIPTISRMRIEWTQSLLTNILYLLAFMILPYLFSVTLLQIIIISSIASEIFITVYKRLNNKRIAWLILIPFCLLSVFDNNQFTLRASIISWLFTYLFINILIAIREKELTSNALLKSSIIIALLAAWKVEYGYLLALYVICLGLFALFNKKRKIYIASIITLFCFYIILTVPNRLFESKGNYLMTSIFTPLSSILAANIDDIYTNTELSPWVNEINAVTPIYAVVDTTTGLNLPDMYWDMEDVTANEQHIWLKAGVKICQYYWKDFLNNRIYLFKYTNGMVPNVINHTGSEDPGIVLNMIYYGKTFFYDNFKLTSPLLGHNIRKTMISILACRDKDDYYKTTLLYPLMYNSLIPLVLISFIAIIDLFSKKYAECLMLISMAGIVFINFILAPAHFWMYYMPFFLAAYSFITVKLIFLIDKKSKFTA